MTQRHRFKTNKLVRNRTNERLIKKEVHMQFRIADMHEYLQLLKTKLIEEAEEVAQAQDTTELIDELADVMEVIHALAAAHGIPLSAIEASRQEKLETRGSFDDRVYSEFVDVNEDHYLYEHYRNHPEKYPEIERK